MDAMTEGRYRLIGSTASPYAIKLRALLRYRRIPFDWVIMTKALRKATEHLRPNLIPALQYPDGTYRGETTALAYRSCSDACSNSGRANSFFESGPPTFVGTKTGGPCPTVKAVPRCLMKPPDCRTLKWV